METSWNTAITIKKVQKDVPCAPFYNYLTVAERLPDRYTPNGDPFDPFQHCGTLFDKLVQAKHGMLVQSSVLYFYFSITKNLYDHSLTSPSFCLSAAIELGASMQFHNWASKLLSRLRKYKKRGIEFIDAPTGRDDIGHRSISLF
jgi:hypothetical protein